MSDETIKLTQVILQAIHAVRTNTANFHESDWELHVNKHHFMLLQAECNVMATSKENYIFGINIVIDNLAVYPVLMRKMPGAVGSLHGGKPMGDLISRKAAIDYMNGLPKWKSLQGYECIDLEDVMSVLEDTEKIPSAEPERNVGHWIYKDGVRGFGIGAWCCSECGEENESLPFHKCKDPYAYVASKYCACCGARMEDEK